MFIPVRRTEPAKESSCFHVHGSHLYVSLAWSSPFSLLWPILLTCSGRASVTATLDSMLGRVMLKTLKNGTGGLSSLVFGVDGWVQSIKQRFSVVLPLTKLN